jgi:hypothetical protein
VRHASVEGPFHGCWGRLRLDRFGEIFSLLIRNPLGHDTAPGRFGSTVS